MSRMVGVPKTKTFSVMLAVAPGERICVESGLSFGAACEFVFSLSFAHETEREYIIVEEEV